MSYIGSSPTKVVSRQSANIFTYTATANQTAFTGADTDGNTLACTPSDIMVHMNGLRLEESDYTASTTTVTLGSGAAAGDEVTITAFLTFESADAYTKSTSDTRYVNTTGDTMTGNLLLGGNKIGVGIAAPTAPIHIKSADNTEFMNFTQTGNERWAFRAESGAGSDDFFGIGISGGVQAIYFHEGGQVRKPSNPCAVWGASGNVALTQDSSWRDVALNYEIFDKNNNYNTTNYRFTAPVTGVYLVGFSGEFTSTSNTVWSYLVPRINGSNTANLSNKGNNFADFSHEGQYRSHGQTWFLNLAQDDYFIFSHIGSGGNITLKNYNECKFFATLLG